MFFNIEFVLRINVCGECAVHGDCLGETRQLFVGCGLLSKKYRLCRLSEGRVSALPSFFGAD